MTSIDCRPGRRCRVHYVMDAIYTPNAGTEAQLRTLISGLDRSCFEPSLTLLRSTDYSRRGSFPCPVDSLDIPGLLSTTAMYRLLALARRLRRDGTNIIHTVFIDSSIVGPLLGKLARIPTIVSRRDTGYWYTPALLRVLRLTGRAVTCVVANSWAVKDVVMQQEGVPASRVRVIRNGYRLARFATRPAPAFRVSLGIGPDDPIIGLVGNVRPVKRIPDLIRAFALLEDRYPTAHVVIIGHPEFREDLDAAIAGLRRPDRVHLCGPFPDVVPYVAHFTVGVLCSDTEGLPNALLEYMGCGIPSVCTRVGGIPEVLSDGRTGYLVSPRCPEELADRLAAILDAQESARQMGRRAQEYFHAHFTEAHMVEAYSALYRALTRPCATHRALLDEEHVSA